MGIPILKNDKRRRRTARRVPAFFGSRAILMCITLPLALYAQSSPASIQSIVNALRSHDPARALALCQELTPARSSDPRVWTLEGMALEDLGERAQSISAFKRALKLDPNYVPALEAAAQIEYGAGAPEAKPLLERLARLQPGNQTVQAMLAALAFKHGDCKTAIARFDQSRTAINQNPPALQEFGACLVRAHDAPAAAAVFQKILALDPGDEWSRYNLGFVQLQKRQYQEAIQTLLPLTKKAAPSAATLNLIAAAYEADGRTPEAVAALRQAIVLAPRSADNYLDLATICLDHKSFQVGVDVLNAGLRALPQSAPLYVERGVLLVQMGRYNQADADFRKAAALSPSQTYGAVALGMALLEQNQPAQSLKIVRERLAKTPDDPVLNYLLAEILLRSGIAPGDSTFNEALAAAKLATERKTGFAAADDVLAELYLRSGQNELAAAASRTALKSDPTDTTAIYHLIIYSRRAGDKKQLASLTAHLAAVSASLQKRDAEQNRFRLVEQTAASSPAH